MGPRDGLQNEKGLLLLDQKITLIEMLEDAGLTSIEVGSFVSPKWVPQMKDTDKILNFLLNGDRLKSTGLATYMSLTPNMTGNSNMIAVYNL